MPKVTSAPVTMGASRAGLAWPGVVTAINHTLHLIETSGPVMADAIKTLLLGIQAATGKDMLGVLAAVNQETVDYHVLAAAVREEFKDYLD